MRPYLLLLVALLTTAATAVCDDGEWFMQYCKSPQPEAIAAKLPELQKQGVLKNPDTKPVILGFFSRIMHDNPGKVEEWLRVSEALGKLPATEQKVLDMVLSSLKSNPSESDLFKRLDNI